MAKELQLSDPRVAALMGQQKRLIPWRSAAYSDGMRHAHPAIAWPEIREKFNSAVPAKRRRTYDSIKNKWRSFQAKLATESTEEDISHCDTYSAAL